MMHNPVSINTLCKIIAVVVVTSFAEISGGIAEDDGTFCSMEKAAPCPSGTRELYHDMDSENSKMCCETGTKAERNQLAKSFSCRPSKCVKPEFHEDSNFGDACSSSSHLKQRIVEGKKLEYENFMEEECNRSGDGTQDGVTALCCPNESLDAYLVTTFGAEPNEFPSMARLTTPGHCGATVYNKRFVITAAHCVVDDFDGYVKPKEGMTVTLAVSSINNMDKERFVYKVKRIIPHKNYSKLRDNPKKKKGYSREFNDIALLELDRDIQFGKSVKALEIAPKGFKPEEYGYQAIVLGWGRNPKKFQWTHLQKVNFILRNDSVCFDALGGYWWTMGDKNDQHLCMGGIVDGNWSPIVGRGDSGGPAICRGQDGHPVLCGLTSFGPPHQKCLDNQDDKHCPPSVFVDVGYFHDWIRENAGEQATRTLHKPYIYGREIAKVVYEHQVHIFSDSGSSCGGTLVRPDAVLTAAQCVFQGDEFEFGEMHSGISVTAADGKKYRVKAADRLPDFKRLWPRLDVDLAHDTFATVDHHKLARDYLYRNDLALIKLSGKVDIDPDRIPRIPYENERFKSGKEIAFTRNTTNRGGNTHLVERIFKILSAAECKRRLARLTMAGMRVQFDDGLLCGLEMYSGGSTCDREFGGGLICGSGGKHVLCGVQVFRLCERTYPNLFVEVGYHSKWIQNKIGRSTK